MARIAVTPLTAALVCALATTVRPTASQTLKPPDDVEKTITAFLSRFASRDVPGFIDYFAADATVFMPPSATGASPVRLQGKAAITREFQQLYQRLSLQPGTPATKIIPVDLLVQRLGDVAVVTFHLGTEATRGRRTMVWVRTSLGWKIAHLHASDFAVR